MTHKEYRTPIFSPKSPEIKTCLLIAVKLPKPYNIVVTVGIFYRYIQIEVITDKKLGFGFLRSPKSEKK